jgi:pimeloyl-ACP methyl ester carboxylesterase
LLEERVVTSDGVGIHTYHLQTPGATKRALLVHGVSYGGPSIFDARIPATVTSVTTTHPAVDAASSPSPSGRGQGEGPLPAVAERSSASEDTSGSVMAQLSARLCEPWTLDIRGYGKSDHPADGRTANGANAQLDIDAAVRRILGGHYGANDPTRGRLILVGYSWGGRTALQYASDHPDLVERLILIAPAAWSPEKGPNYRQQRDAMIPPDDGGGYVTQTVERFKSRLRKYPDDDPRVIDSWLERAIAHDPRSPLGAFYDYDDMPPGPMSDLSKITMPLRIVVGKDDPIYQPYYQELLNRSATTDKALIEVPDTDHWWMLHATRARFAQEIVAAALD